MKLLLYPFGLLYMFATWLNRGMYALGFFKRKKLPKTVISIGNLTMGGSGKTPFTLYLAERLIALGKKPAIILRGYGRKTRGPILVSKDTSAEEVGEEALLYKSGHDIDVAVSEKREKALSVLPALTDVYLLDDAFQHFGVYRDRDILIVDASRPDDLKPMPLGRLREPLGSAKYASLVVITRGTKKDLPVRLQKIIAGKPTVEVEFHWEELLCPDRIPRSSATRNRYFLLLGIGNPNHFKMMAEAGGYKITGEKILPDHAFPAPGLVAEINASAKKSGADYILTSEKDFVKWSKVKELKLKIVYPELMLSVRDPENHLDKMISEL
jgi:tetraacyldisaccharide 4'-kinase